MQIENCKLEIANLIRSNHGVRSRIHRDLESFPGRTTELRDTSCSDYHVQSFGSNYSTKLKSNLQFVIFNFQFSILFPLLLCSLLFALCASTQAQVIADKAVASVTNGARATPDLITYSDIVWQLAIEPGRPFSAQPNSHDLNQ